MSEYLPSRNPIVRQIEESLKLTRNLFVSTLLMGEPHTGKRSLVRQIFPHLTRADGRDRKQLEQLLEREQELIIEHFDAIHAPEKLDLEGKRIIAIADSIRQNERDDRIFAFIYRMPPLRERPEDLEALTKHFLERARELLQTETEIEPKELFPDLGENFLTFRSSIYREVLLRDLSEEELERGLYHSLLHHMEGNNAYREKLGIFERPLLRAGLKRYGSQLKLAEALGINRNTLRKKLHEYRID